MIAAQQEVYKGAQVHVWNQLLAHQIGLKALSKDMAPLSIDTFSVYSKPIQSNKMHRLFNYASPAVSFFPTSML